MWNLRKLKKWAGPALQYEKLVTIARTAPSAKQAKNQALEFAKNKGLGEEVAKACRWLMIIRRDYGPETQEEFISSAKEAIAREERKMEKKIKKRKKTTKRVKGWILYHCPHCNHYQEADNRCENCKFERTERKVIKTGAEYCESLRNYEGEPAHEYKQVGQTGPVAREKGSLLKSAMHVYMKVYRCVRCDSKKVEIGKEPTDLPQCLPTQWGEQPQDNLR